MKKTLVLAMSVGFCSFITAGDSRSAANSIMKSSAQFQVDQQQRMLRHSTVPVSSLQVQRDMQVAGTPPAQQQSNMRSINQHNYNVATGKKN